jgi:hypothetical protein
MKKKEGIARGKEGICKGFLIYEILNGGMAEKLNA